MQALWSRLCVLASIWYFHVFMSSFLAMFILLLKNVGDFYLCSRACGAFAGCQLDPRHGTQNLGAEKQIIIRMSRKGDDEFGKHPLLGEKGAVAASERDEVLTDMKRSAHFLLNLLLINGSNPLIECCIKHAFVSIHSHFQWDCSPSWLNVTSQNKNVTFNLKETRHLWPSPCAASLSQLPFSEMLFSSHPFYRFLLKEMADTSPLTTIPFRVCCLFLVESFFALEF